MSHCFIIIDQQSLKLQWNSYFFVSYNFIQNDNMCIFCNTIYLMYNVCLSSMTNISSKKIITNQVINELIFKLKPVKDNII